MGRLLDEDDVIRTVDEHTNDDNALDDDITCVLENVPTAQSLNWISCEKRLPDYNTNVLLSVKEGTYVAEGCLKVDHKWCQFRWNSTLKFNSVDAWCDMPEPYKPKMTPQKAAEILNNEKTCVLSNMRERTECKNCTFMNENEMLDALNMAIEVLQEKEK